MYYHYSIDFIDANDGNVLTDEGYVFATNYTEAVTRLEEYYDGDLILNLEINFLSEDAILTKEFIE